MPTLTKALPIALFCCCRSSLLPSQSFVFQTHSTIHRPPPTSLHQTTKSAEYNDELGNSLINLQTETSTQISSQSSSSSSSTTTTLSNHLKLQRDTFDQISQAFDDDENPPPPEVFTMLNLFAYRSLTTMLQHHHSKPKDDHTYQILDVGCGTGAMFGPLLHAFDVIGNSDEKLSITGVDLSEEMVKRARVNAEQRLLEYDDDDDDRYSIEVLDADDFCSMVLLEEEEEEKEGGGEEGGGVLYEYDKMSEVTKGKLGSFDLVIVNACFANFYDTKMVMKALTKSLALGGILSITHPLGRAFVEKLHTQSPSTVPHLLPSHTQFLQLCLPHPLVVLCHHDDDHFDTIIDEELPSDLIVDTTDKRRSRDGYLTMAKRVAYIPTKSLLKFRGVVGRGYGRGGKKLGFPTANLSPSEVFHRALSSSGGVVLTGVYFGWAVIEGSSSGGDNNNNVIHKAVVNVGYSPTFEGEENREKIIEAHLIIDNDDDDNQGKPVDDFYGETMRLVLCGFLRPECKFDSFDDLIRAIGLDRDRAIEALVDGDDDVRSVYEMVRDDFLNVNVDWVGKDGGDDVASWEFRSMEEVLFD